MLFENTKIIQSFSIHFCFSRKMIKTGKIINSLPMLMHPTWPDSMSHSCAAVKSGPTEGAPPVASPWRGLSHKPNSTCERQ